MDKKPKDIQSKRRITILSIIASGTLTAFKFFIGFLTGSLGLIAEGMHSLLDVLTSLITYIAVKIASKPPDANHPYGHERAEALGALAGMAILGTTACLILYHALRKIIWEPAAPEIMIWSFVVILTTILVDYLRVRSLRKAAHYYKSQALASDAEHFNNDMLGSFAVLLGLSCVYLSKYIPIPDWLVTRVDAIAALAVVVIAIKSVWHLGFKAIRSLMDDVPIDLAPRLKNLVENIPGINPGTVFIRSRFLGNKPYIEAIVGAARDLTFEKSHELTEEVERTIANEFGGEAEVIVHAEPTPSIGEPYGITVRAVADQMGVRIHNLNLYDVAGEIRIGLDLEVPDDLTVQEAHVKSKMLEQALTGEFNERIKVSVHIEPRNDALRTATHKKDLTKRTQEALIQYGHPKGVFLEDAFQTEEGWIVILRMEIDGQTSLAKAHTLMYNFEHSLRTIIPEITRIHIDPEPII